MVIDRFSQTDRDALDALYRRVFGPDAAEASRLRNTVGDSRPAYKYESDVENFFRHSPAVVRD